MENKEVVVLGLKEYKSTALGKLMKSLAKGLKFPCKATLSKHNEIGDPVYKLPNGRNIANRHIVTPSQN